MRKVDQKAAQRADAALIQIGKHLNEAQHRARELQRVLCLEWRQANPEADQMASIPIPDGHPLEEARAECVKIANRIKAIGNGQSDVGKLVIGMAKAVIGDWENSLELDPYDYQIKNLENGYKNTNNTIYIWIAINKSMIFHRNFPDWCNAYLYKVSKHISDVSNLIHSEFIFKEIYRSEKTSEMARVALSEIQAVMGLGQSGKNPIMGYVNNIMTTSDSQTVEARSRYKSIDPNTKIGRSLDEIAKLRKYSPTNKESRNRLLRDLMKRASELLKEHPKKAEETSSEVLP